MKSYSNYKDSGVKWLGQIPQHWEVRRLKGMSSCNDESLSNNINPSTEIDYVEISDVNAHDGITGCTRYAFSDAPSRARRITRKGDVIVSTVRTYLKAVALIKEDNLIVSTGFAVLRAKDCNEAYLSYALRTEGFVDEVATRSIGISYPAISTDQLGAISLPLPPLSEQLSIVSYLDGKVSAMDRLVLLTQQKVEHLKALKQAIIQEAVTKGIPNKNHILKQTNIKWIKQIPQHWEEIRLGRLFTENKKINSDLACMEAYKFNYGSLVRKDLGIDPKELQDTYSKYTVLKDRDIVINGLNLNYDFVSVRVAQAFQKGVITSAYLVLEPRKNICDKYYCWLLKAMDYMKLFHGMGSGIRLTLSYKDLKNQLLPLPPLSEQEEIVAYLDEKTAKIDLLIDKELQQIDHIKDLKQTLIADVVTGKVDVTTKH